MSTKSRSISSWDREITSAPIFIARRMAPFSNCRLAWYSERGGHWGMNPGYDTPIQPNSRRKIGYDCMFCHNAYPEIPAGHDQLRAEPVFTGDDSRRDRLPAMSRTRRPPHSDRESLRARTSKRFENQS